VPIALDLDSEAALGPLSTMPNRLCFISSLVLVIVAYLYFGVFWERERAHSLDGEDGFRAPQHHARTGFCLISSLVLIIVAYLYFWFLCYLKHFGVKIDSNIGKESRALVLGFGFGYSNHLFIVYQYQRNIKVQSLLP
jgi:hypothetical protein